MVLSFNMTQTRVVIGLLAGHNTLRRHLYIMELIDSPLCRRCGAQEEISARVLSVKPWLHSDVPTLAPVLGPWGRQKSGASGTAVKDQGSHDLDIRLWGTKSLSKRAWTSLLFYLILFYLFTTAQQWFLSLKQNKIFTFAALCLPHYNTSIMSEWRTKLTSSLYHSYKNIHVISSPFDYRSEDSYRQCGISYFATGRTLTSLHTKATVFLYFQLLSHLFVLKI
jgi:hypothetical protein